VADCLASGVHNYGVTSTITYDRPMASVQNESFSFVLQKKILNRLTGYGLVPLFPHGSLHSKCWKRFDLYSCVEWRIGGAYFLFPIISSRKMDFFEDCPRYVNEWVR
jgi:hypothetical protein